MPAADVTVTAEMRVLSVPTAESGMGWTRTHDLVAGGINDSFEVTFGTDPVLNSVVQNEDGYSTLALVKVISTNQQVIPDKAIYRVNGSGSNGAYVYAARISFTSDLLSPGETTLVLIDTDNDRAITLDVTVVARNY